MSSGTTPFSERFGQPDPSQPNGLTFTEEWARGLWQDVVKDTGSGAFLDGFVRLFGQDLRDLDPVPAAWSFLFRESKTRWVIGRNAYGALLLLESPDEDGTMGSVGLLDPLTVRYFRDDNLDLLGLVGDWLPNGKLPNFLTDSVHAAFGGPVAVDEVLAIKTPLSLGGKMELANFQVENIFDYYRSTGEIYGKRFDGDEAR